MLWLSIFIWIFQFFWEPQFLQIIVFIESLHLFKKQSRLRPTRQLVRWAQKMRLEIVQPNMRETFQSITNWLAGIDVVMFDQVNLDSIRVSFSFFMQSYNAKLIPIRTRWLMDFISLPRRICHYAWLMHGAHRSDICFTTETRCVIARYNKWEAIQLMRSSRALSCVCFAKIDLQGWKTITAVSKTNRTRADAKCIIELVFYALKVNWKCCMLAHYSSSVEG